MDSKLAPRLLHMTGAAGIEPQTLDLGSYALTTRPRAPKKRWKERMEGRKYIVKINTYCPDCQILIYMQTDIVYMASINIQETEY